MTKITLENEHGIYSVATEANVDHIVCLLKRIIKPCLIASGYGPSLIDDMIPLSDDDCLECYGE